MNNEENLIYFINVMKKQYRICLINKMYENNRHICLLILFFLKIKLNSDQERERSSLKVTLDEDYRNLLNLQEESRLRMEQQHLDERKQLDRNIEDRLKKLNEQVLYDSLKLTIMMSVKETLSL